MHVGVKVGMVVRILYGGCKEVWTSDIVDIAFQIDGGVLGMPRKLGRDASNISYLRDANEPRSREGVKMERSSAIQRATGLGQKPRSEEKGGWRGRR